MINISLKISIRFSSLFDSERTLKKIWRRYDRISRFDGPSIEYVSY